MTSAQIKAMQEKIGVKPDGFWGPKSIDAVQKHLRNLMPRDNPWPNTDQASLTRFYGAAGDEDRLCDLIVEGLGVKYVGEAVRTIRCNRKIAGSLLRIIKKLSLSHPYVLADYNGCYNNRSMRGGSLPSLHARGAAIDFLAGENGNKTSWPAKATMPLEVMEIFAIEGVLSAGAFWGRDAMHAQWTR